MTTETELRRTLLQAVEVMRRAAYELTVNDPNPTAKRVVHDLDMFCEPVARRALSARPADPAAPQADYMCPNCVTPWKCNWPHFLEGEEPRPPNRPPPDDAVGA